MVFIAPDSKNRNTVQTKAVVAWMGGDMQMFPSDVTKNSAYTVLWKQQSITAPPLLFLKPSWLVYIYIYCILQTPTSIP